MCYTFDSFLSSPLFFPHLLSLSILNLFPHFHVDCLGVYSCYWVIHWGPWQLSLSVVYWQLSPSVIYWQLSLSVIYWQLSLSVIYWQLSPSVIYWQLSPSVIYWQLSLSVIYWQLSPSVVYWQLLYCLNEILSTISTIGPTRCSICFQFITINSFRSNVGPRPTLWFSCSAAMSEDIRHVFLLRLSSRSAVGACPTLFLM
jgi:hypothetical protein